MTQLPQCEFLALKLDGPRLDILFNRPQQRNAINAAMGREIAAVVDWLEAPSSVRLVTLRGAGGHFCAGGDIKERRSLADTDQGVEAILERNRNAGHSFLRFAKLPQTTVSLVEGSAFGGGLGYACLTDITIVTRGARMGMPETRLGVAPAQIASWVVKRLGLTRARQLALTGERFDGETAFAYGVAHYLCDDGQAERMLEEVAGKVLACGPLASAATKRIMGAVGTLPDADLIELAAREFAALNRSGEGLEGQSAFAEKRAPNWGAA